MFLKKCSFFYYTIILFGFFLFKKPIFLLYYNSICFFLFKKPNLWSGEEAQKGQVSEPPENWFPVDWGQGDKEEEKEKELFEVRITTQL